VRIKVLVLLGRRSTQQPNLVKLSFESEAPGNLERLTLFLKTGSAASVLGIQNLLKLRAVELFGIKDGHVVNTVMEEVNSHPNKPIRAVAKPAQKMT